MQLEYPRECRYKYIIYNMQESNIISYQFRGIQAKVGLRSSDSYVCT